MKKDLYDLPVTTSSEEVIEALNHFHQQLLNNGNEGGKILEAAEKHPEAMLIQTYAAATLLYAQDSQCDSKALKYLNAAKTLLPEVSKRERLIFQAINAWYERDYPVALNLLSEITTQWPSDCSSLKMAEWIFYCAGQPNHAKAFLSMCEKMHEHCKHHSGFLAIHSFALELNQQYEAAMDMAFDALSMNPITPWAHHTISHVTLNTSKIDTGIILFQQYAPTWKNISSFLRGHLHWHYSLFAIANRDESAANLHYQDGIWGINPEAVLQHVDAIAYLWRMQIAGMPQDKKLLDVIKYLEQHPFEFYMPFVSAHYVYALARNNDFENIEEMLVRLYFHIEQNNEYQCHIWRKIALPLFNATAAFAQENYKAAAKTFESIMPFITQGGGSDAQNEIFYQAYLVSLIKSGQIKKAKAIFDAQLSHYKSTALGEYWHSLQNSNKPLFKIV